MTDVIGIEEIPVMRVFTACISVIGEHQISESKPFCTFLSTLENKPIRMWTLTVLVNLLLLLLLNVPQMKIVRNCGCNRTTYNMLDNKTLSYIENFIKIQNKTFTFYKK